MIHIPPVEHATDRLLAKLYKPILLVKAPILWIRRAKDYFGGRVLLQQLLDEVPQSRRAQAPTLHVRGDTQELDVPEGTKHFAERMLGGRQAAVHLPRGKHLQVL